MKNKLLKAISGLSLTGIGASVYAAVPAPVTAQVTETQADLTTIGGLIVGLAVLVMAFRWMKAMFF